MDDRQDELEESREAVAEEISEEAQDHPNSDTGDSLNDDPVTAIPVAEVVPVDQADRSGKRREPKYVTRTALVICMILTMLVSAAVGSLVGALAGGWTPGSSASTDSTSDKDTSSTGSQDTHLSLADATGSELTIAEIIDKNEDSVVEIVVSGTTQNYFGQTQLTEGAGSGVIMTSDGYIATNYHVIDGANKVQVTLHNGDSYNAVIVGGDSDNDIAVVKINATGLTPVELGDSSLVNVGDLAVAIGNPLGQLGGTATSGIISALDRNLTVEGKTLNLFQTDASINPGNSGGGLFNSRGQLIGIVESKASAEGVEGIGFALPINSVYSIIDDLITNGSVTARPVIGIMIQDVSEENAEYYGFEVAGVYIAQVTGENAQKAGFQEGDRIISLDGEEINSSNDLIQKVRKHKVGDTVSVVVSRSGQMIEIRTILEGSAATD